MKHVNLSTRAWDHSDQKHRKLDRKYIARINTRSTDTLSQVYQSIVLLSHWWLSQSTFTAERKASPKSANQEWLPVLGRPYSSAISHFLQIIGPSCRRAPSITGTGTLILSDWGMANSKIWYSFLHAVQSKRIFLSASRSKLCRLSWMVWRK